MKNEDLVIGKDLTNLIGVVVKELNDNEETEFIEKFSDLKEFIEKFVIEYSLIVLCKLFINHNTINKTYSPKNSIYSIISNLRVIEQLKKNNFGIDAEEEYLRAISEEFIDNENYGTF